MKPLDRQLAASRDQFLPPELLSWIFRMTLQEESESKPVTIRSSPLSLGMVSKRWREIAHATPKLWTAICVHASETTSLPLLASGVRAWLSRAGPRPLSLRLSVQNMSEETFPQIALLTEAALEFSLQIRRLHIRFPAERHCYASVLGTQNYIVLGNGGFPLLETLDIDCPFDHDDAVLEQIIESATALHDLTLLNYPSKLSTLPVPLHQLKRLVCGPNEPWTTLPDVLHGAPDLEECRFWFLALVGVFATEVIVHRRLCRLHFGPVGFDEFLDWVDLPALTHLTFEGTNAPRTGGGPILLAAGWNQTSMMGFLARSRCSLEHLAFSKINITTQDLVACLEMVSPTLTSLCIEGGTYGLVEGALLARLTAQASDDITNTQAPVLCPRLEVIRMLGGTLEREGYGSGVVAMLESRFYGTTPGVANLKSAYIRGTLGTLQRKRVNKLNQDGLDLTFVLEGNMFL